MKLAGEHINDGLASHDGKYFFYSVLAVLCASYCGVYFLRLNTIPTVMIALSVALAVAWQFRLRGNIRMTDRQDLLNNRSVITIENSVPTPQNSIYQFLLQVYLWCGLSMKRNNAVLTTHIAKLPMQFFKTIKIASGMMEKTIPWKILCLEDTGNDLNNLLTIMLLTNLIDPHHKLLVVTQRPMSGVDDLFGVEHSTQTIIDTITRCHSLGRPLTVITIGSSTEELTTLIEETGIPIIPIQTRFEDSSLAISVGSPIQNGGDIDTYVQVESNRASRILH